MVAVGGFGGWHQTLFVCPQRAFDSSVGIRNAVGTLGKFFDSGRMEAAAFVPLQSHETNKHAIGHKETSKRAQPETQSGQKGGKNGSGSGF